MLWCIAAPDTPDTISAHAVSVKILRRFHAEHSCPHHTIGKKRRAACRLAFGFSGPPFFNLVGGIQRHNGRVNTHGEAWKDPVNPVKKTPGNFDQCVFAPSPQSFSLYIYIYYIYNHIYLDISLYIDKLIDIYRYLNMFIYIDIYIYTIIYITIFIDLYIYTCIFIFIYVYI